VNITVLQVENQTVQLLLSGENGPTHLRVGDSS